MKTLKVLSALLSYPTQALLEAGGELKEIVAREGLLAADAIAGLNDFIDRLSAMDVVEAQEAYVDLFDRSRALSLHLFEHVHGESRDRGQAMVDLMQLYAAAGFETTASELPDYLPLFLEFASMRPPQEAVELISQPAHVIAALHERLKRRNAPYAAATAALIALAHAEIDADTLSRLMAEPDPAPDDLEALDAAWEEEEVLFGPGAAADDCGRDQLAARLRQARRPAEGLAPVRTGPRVEVTHSSASRG